MDRSKSDIKLVINCSLCGKKELQVIKKDDDELMQCLSCGYASSNIYLGDMKTNETFKSLEEDTKKFAKESNGQIWIPAVMSMPVGVYYPHSFDEDKNLKWAFSPIVDILEEEQKHYPKPDGGFFKQRYDLDSEQIFDFFGEGIIRINNQYEEEISLKAPKDERFVQDSV
tara:strand:+ start:2962 stop:3471 length:510 start_codon:yes stop_codon:yes gene_type:complete